MSFMHWWENILYYPEGQLNADHDLYKKVSAMPEESIWQFMELYNGTLGQHGFCVCHASRPEKTYKIDFSADAFMDYVPVLRCVEVKPESRCPKAASSSDASRVRPIRSIPQHRRCSVGSTAKGRSASALPPADSRAKTPRRSAGRRSGISGD